MEYVNGRSLRDELDAGTVSLRDVRRYGVQAADALAHAHEHGVIHRDFKAGNAIIAGGRLKVVDFGLARRDDVFLPDATTAASIVPAGVAAGTPYAMAPEQIRGSAADARTDIWALGVLLYEMAGGGRPFEGGTTPELFSSILRDDPRPLPATVPVGVKGVIDRCLIKDPERRYQHAAEVRAALDALETTGGVLAPVRRSLNWKKGLVAAAAALALTAGVLAGLNREWIRSRWLETGPRIDSLAVLPLENLSGEASEDYFADGMTEVLSTDLARLSGLKRVTARGSVMRYKGSNTPLDQIARELNVDALVMGSVQRSGRRVSITAQLLDPGSGDQLWTNRYERDLEDMLALRNEIVSAIVREIRAQLSPGEQTRLAARGRVNADAFEAYLKGRFHWLRQTREDFDQAERYFQFALEKDPTYALAYAGLGSVWMMRGDAGFRPPSETVPVAERVHGQGARTRRRPRRRARAAGRSAGRGVGLAGGRTRIPGGDRGESEPGGRPLLLCRSPADGSQQSRRLESRDAACAGAGPAERLQPKLLRMAPHFLRRYGEAIPIFEQLLPSGPNKASNYLGLWGAYFRTGRYEDALRAARDYFEAAGDGEFATALGTGQDRAAYRAAMIRTGEMMAARSATRHVPAIRIARMFAHAGDTERAMQWLERAYRTANRRSRVWPSSGIGTT